MTTLTLTVNQALEAYAAIEAWGKQKLPAKAAYWLAVTKRRLQPAVEPFVETRDAMLDEYKPEASAEANAAFAQAMAGVLAEQIDVDVRDAHPDMFGDAAVPPAIILPLLPFLQDTTKWDVIETTLPFTEAAGASAELALVMRDGMPMLGAYLVARVADAVRLHTEDFWSWRQEEAKRRGLVDEQGTLNFKSPDFPAFLAEIERNAKERAGVVIRHPHVPFDVLDRPGVAVSETLVSALWFVWKDEDD